MQHRAATQLDLGSGSGSCRELTGRLTPEYTCWLLTLSCLLSTNGTLLLLFIFAFADSFLIRTCLGILFCLSSPQLHTLTHISLSSSASFPSPDLWLFSLLTRRFSKPSTCLSVFFAVPPCPAAVRSDQSFVLHVALLSSPAVLGLCLSCYQAAVYDGRGSAWLALLGLNCPRPQRVSAGGVVGPESLPSLFPLQAIADRE